MIVVTGGSGQAGRACVRDLMEHGYDVTSIDLVPPADPKVRFSRADVTDFGQAMAALSMIDERVAKVTGVVHLAAIRAPGLAPNHVTFAVNTVRPTTSSRRRGSSASGTSCGHRARPSTAFPIRTARPMCRSTRRSSSRETAYSLSKLMGEKMAEQFCRWDPELKIVGLRFSNVMDPQDYERFPASTRTPARATGTCGPTSTRATPRRRSGCRCRRSSPARMCSASPMPIR